MVGKYSLVLRLFSRRGLGTRLGRKRALAEYLTLIMNIIEIMVRLKPDQPDQLLCLGRQVRLVHESVVAAKKSTSANLASPLNPSPIQLRYFHFSEVLSMWKFIPWIKLRGKP